MYKVTMKKNGGTIHQTKFQNRGNVKLQLESFEYNQKAKITGKTKKGKVEITNLTTSNGEKLEYVVEVEK